VYRLTSLAWSRNDLDATAKFARKFLEADGLSSYGAQVIKFAADTCFVGFAEAIKANDDAAEALKNARATHQKANADAKKTQTPPAAKEAAEKALATAKDALDKAQAKADTAQKTLDETRTKSIAKFDALLPSLEKYLTRTIAWSGAIASVDATFKPHLALKPMAGEAKRLNETMNRVRQNELVKASMAGFQTARVAGQWAKAGTAGEILLPKFLEAGPALALEGGGDVLAAMYNGGQYEKGINAAKLILAKYPAAAGTLYYLSLCANQLGAPKNRDAVALVDATVAQAGGSYWPYDGWGNIRNYTFTVAEQNRQSEVMLAEFKHLATLYPGSSGAHEYQRRIGAMQATLGQNEAAKQTLLAALKSAQPIAAEPGTLHVIATAFTNAADWALPLLDAYLARPTRGPQQGGVQLLRGNLLLTEKKDTNGAIKSVQLAAARSGDFAWAAASVPWQWGETLLQTVASAKVEEAKPADVALLSDIITSLGAVQAHWMPAMLVRQAQLNQALDFAHTVNRITVGMNPNDANWLANYYIPWSQQVASLGKPELSGLILRAAVNRFTGVDPKLRAQASQALFSLSNKHGFPAAEIDEKLEWAPLLKSAASGSKVTATLTETGPHTGIFRGTLKTVEIAANIFASDRSVGNEAVRAIDNNPKTAWEGLNDGRAPKFLVVDLKQPTKLGALKWSTDGFFKDKKPVEYAIQVSTNLTEWTTVAATTNFTGSTAEQRARIVSTNAGNFSGASIQLTNASGRYVRLFIEKFSGTAPRIAELEVTDAAGTLLLPTRGEAEVATGDALRLTPSD
ncbi:MAG: hypothetical protein EBY09_15375, partial [Verrucomicrobia bacterium]|nr:hypothetical protein [Verrucomicrobiota bacterium]NDE99805.1 hypothetical protein [Verrucomicrobiota bacterium]